MATAALVENSTLCRKFPMYLEVMFSFKLGAVQKIPNASGRVGGQIFVTVRGKMVLMCATLPYIGGGEFKFLKKRYVLLSVSFKLCVSNYVTSYIEYYSKLTALCIFLTSAPVATFNT